MRGAMRWMANRASVLDALFAALLREFRQHTNPANHRSFQIDPIAHPLQRAGVLVTGFSTLMLAGVGAIVPVMPVSPFALVALFCFARTSSRVRRWITRNHIVKSAVSFIWSRSERPFVWVRWCAVRFGGLRLMNAHF